MIFVSHPFGNPNAYNLAAGLHARGKLSAFHTSLFGPFGTRYRWHPELDGAPVYQHRAAEWFRLGMTRCPVKQWNGRSNQFVDWVTEQFDRKVARTVSRSVSGVYCYEDGAQATFLRAKELLRPAVYDLPTGYFEAKSSLVSEIKGDASLNPFFPALNEPEEKLERKRRELEMADLVVCASNFTRLSVADRLSPRQSVAVVPYGVDLDPAPKKWTRDEREGPLRVLFIGALAPQKGLHHLFQAVSELPRDAVRLSLAGRWVSGFREWIQERYGASFAALGQVPHARVPEVCRENHVLVFPSLFDGFGLVILEAMAAGIPVIASSSCGGPDVIDQFEDGIVVPAGAPPRLREAIGWMLEHRDRVAKMGSLARRKAEQFTWKNYRERMAAELAPYVN